MAATITQPTTLTYTPPDRSTQAAAPFSANATDFAGAMKSFGNELQTFATEANTLASEAETDAANAASSEEAAVAAANYKGDWPIADDGTASGALSVPASETHNGSIWLLTEDVAAVENEEPGVSAKWLKISPPAPGLNLIATATASSDATIDFTSGIDDTYDEYEVHLQNVIPVDDAKSLTIRTSTDGGSTFDSGASDYEWAFQIFRSNDTEGSTGNTGQGFIPIISALGSAANEAGFSGVINLSVPSQAEYTQLFWRGGGTDWNGNTQTVNGFGQRLAASDVNAIRFLFSSGNVESGKFKLYGVKKS